MLRTGTHIATSPVDPRSIPQHNEAPAYRFDRRRGDRHPVGGSATGMRRDHDVRAFERPVCSLQMRNLSHGGLAAISDTQLMPHERISVFIPAHGGDGGQELHGHVLRCISLTKAESTAYGSAYDVAIRFDAIKAAA